MSGAPIDVFILGTVFSGSTIVGNALGTHPEAFFAGEVAALPKNSKTYNVMHEIDGCLACAALGRPCPVWTPERKARVEEAGPKRYMDALRADVGRRVIVDGSKLTGWFRVVAGAGALARERVRVIITSKDPMSFVDSLMRRNREAPAWVAANLWRDTYFDLLRTMHGSRYLFTHVAYKDFMREPESVIRGLCALTGLDFDPAMLDFRSASVCSIGGNPGAHVWREGMLGAIEKKKEWVDDIERRHYETYKENAFTGTWVDDKWTERLGTGELAQVMGTPGLPDLATLLGYDLSALARML